MSSSSAPFEAMTCFAGDVGCVPFPTASRGAGLRSMGRANLPFESERLGEAAGDKLRVMETSAAPTPATTPPPPPPPPAPAK